MPIESARISPLDRGFIFGDAVYEGLRSFSMPTGPCHVVGLQRHMDRLANALLETGIAWDARAMPRLVQDLLDANSMADAFVYLQVSRGTPDAGNPIRARIPARGMRPTVFAFCTAQPPLAQFSTPAAKSAVILDDARWMRGHIKSTSLMGNILTTLDADASGADDAIMVRNGLAGEATATNIIVSLTRRGERLLLTPPLATAEGRTPPILAGVTRAILLQHCPDLREATIEADELRSAHEIMLTGTSTMVASVTRLEGRPVGDGAVGPHSKRLLQTLCDAISRRA